MAQLSKPPIPLTMYKHFAVGTLTMTACIAMFANGGNRAAIARQWPGKSDCTLARKNWPLRKHRLPRRRFWCGGILPRAVLPARKLAHRQLAAAVVAVRAALERRAGASGPSLDAPG